MFVKAQGADPPQDPRAWILDLNDKMETLVKGGADDSPLYRAFTQELVETFQQIEERIRGDLDAASDPATRFAIEERPIKDYLPQTASQIMQDFIKTHQATSDVEAQHQDIT